MKKILLFIAISVLIFSNKIASAEWSMYGETEAGYHFIDLNNTSSDDRYVYYWILTDYKEPQKNNVIDDSFLSKKVYKQTDCRRFRTSASEIIIYSKKMSEGKIIVKEKYDDYKYNYKDYHGNEIRHYFIDIISILISF